MLGHVVLLLRQLVQLTLERGPPAAGLRVAVGDHLLRPRAGLADDLPGLLPRLREQPLGVVLTVAPGLVGLGDGRRGALLGVGRPPFRLRDELAGGGLYAREPLRFGPLGFFAASREIDFEVGFRLRPQCLALLEQELFPAADLVGLAPGRGDDLVPLPCRRSLLLARLAVRGRAQAGQLTLGRRAERGDFPVDGRPRLRGVGLGRGPDLVGLGADSPDILSGLLLGRLEQLLDPGSGDRLRRRLLELPDPAIRLAQLGGQLPQLLVDLARGVAVHFTHERTPRRLF